MEKIKEFYQMINDALNPVIDGINKFMGKGWNIIYTGILLVVAILTIVGLIRLLIKLPKTFIIVFLLIAAFCVGGFFLIYQ